MSLAVLALTLVLAAPPAARPALTTRLAAPARLTVGDPFELVLTLSRADSSQVIGPLADTLGVFLPAPRRGAPAGRAGHGREIHRLRLAAFRPGQHRLPVFTFLVRSGARLDTLRSDSLKVTVASVLPRDMKDIRDLKPAEAFPDLRPWIALALLVLAAALAYAGSRLYRRLRRSREIAGSPLPPWEQALAELDRLPWREWLESGQVKRCHYALSQVLKRYIERRFGFNALEQTTTEILASMRTHQVPMREEVRRFLDRSDLAKYAKTVPAEEEFQSAIAEVRDFVTRTRPAEPAPAPPAGPGAPRTLEARA